MNQKYNKEIEKQIYEIIKKENTTFEEISRKLNISYDDLKEYINKSSRKYKKSLVKKIRKARDEYFLDAKIKIENALIKKALGYYSKEIIREIKTDKEGKESKNRKIIYKYNAPSERAIIVFFEILKNRNNKKLEEVELKRNIQEEDNKINIRVGFDN
ncbi:hypothetical protein OFR22_03845 [Brachyspira hyodysenteriae]|uniref:hypothetical protein n=1 Tax=Brachyspira hyodysenteriae TaxID=159 RepID=UPI00063DADEB|nr:hypothetical protein [Brachyspira hyodysenteriae]KLI16259.1 hypothetical protein SU44_06700 [Brachyspira hyodysenteriae]KLI17817.1 hypothetical protein SU46_08525 [Brachyspira hyodysenteriae]KLI37603.1 hypothetical protein SZ51_08735 [Brachyspira hyodysenteriae]KLI40737.1 hypothetical protein SZ53_07975 [Brachyspira hyodysenteriae]MBT8719485.1 hypothetical protein [Brachyspira hyodysenteriae]